METSSFLARKTLGQPNYLLIALVAAFVIALAPYSAREAVNRSANRTEDWLPDSYEQSQDLAWFRANFLGEQFVLVSWDGCTLGDTEKLDLLAKKLAGQPAPTARAAHSASATRSPWFSRVITGPGVLEELTKAPLNLSYDEAVKRLEGVLVGPRDRDSAGVALGHDARTTCLVSHLSPAATRTNHSMRAAIDHMISVAERECGIDAATLHMGGPPIDNIAIDAESQRTLMPTAALAGIVGIALCYWRLRSVKLTAVVFAVGAISAAASVAIVFYVGVFEVLALGRPTPRMGTVDAILLAMPALVYVLALSGALHLVNCYRHVRLESGLAGAAERAARMSWQPAIFAACVMAAAVASLVANDIVPIQRFGLFAAAGVLAAVGVLFAIVPVCLHRFPITEVECQRTSRGGRLAHLARAAFDSTFQRRALTLTCWLAAMALAGLGVTRLGASIHLQNLLGDRARITRDYAWLEQHLGNLAPVEIVVTMPPERLRAASELAEQDGQQYRLTMLERMELVRDLERRIAAVPNISGALSAATFGPPAASKTRADHSIDYALSKSLEQHRKLLLSSDFLQSERRPASGEATGRELWRISARLKAIPTDGADPTDFSRALEDVQDAISPILLAYQQRDAVTQALHEQAKQLAGARVCILFRAPGQARMPDKSSQESILASLLRRTGAAPRGVTYFNLAAYDHPRRNDPAKDDDYRQNAIAALLKQDIVVLAAASSDPTVKQLAASGAAIVDVSDMPSVDESTATTVVDNGGPRPIRAVITGTIPVLDRTQRQLAESMKAGVFWAAVLILGMMIVLLRSAVAALAAFLSSALPLVVTFGALGWAGIEIDLGVMMAASVALALAVDGAIHYLAWFRRAISTGLPRQQAAINAYEQSAEPILQSTVIAGFGMLVFTFSTFTPLQQFGYLMIAMLGLALVGNLLVLPALVASPLGMFFRAPITQPRTATAAARTAGPPAPHLRTTTRPATPVPAEPARPAHLRAVISAGDRHEVAHGPHSALQAKLQELRRAVGRESQGSSES
jgi:predicted RND superfamily exporter protein